MISPVDRFNHGRTRPSIRVAVLRFPADNAEGYLAAIAAGFVKTHTDPHQSRIIEPTERCATVFDQ